MYSKVLQRGRRCILAESDSAENFVDILQERRGVT